MKKITLLAFIFMVSMVLAGTASAQRDLAPGEKKLSPGPDSQKIIDKEEASGPKDKLTPERSDSKPSVKKKVVKKAGKAAAGGVVTKKAVDAVTDKIKE